MYAYDSYILCPDKTLDPYTSPAGVNSFTPHSHPHSSANFNTVLKFHRTCTGKDVLDVESGSPMSGFPKLHDMDAAELQRFLNGPGIPLRWCIFGVEVEAANLAARDPVVLEVEVAAPAASW
ncbi:hypothetical protein RJZ57_002839 [Blastomyces gilchristii]